MKIKREIFRKNNSTINKGRITDATYGKVCIDTEKKEDVFKSHSHIIGHRARAIEKEYEIKENVKVTLRGETKIEGKIKGDMEMSSDRFTLNPAIRLEEQSTAGVSGLEKEIKLSGLHVKGRAEAGLQANADIGAEGMFHVSSKEWEFGFKVADRIELGTYEGFNLSACTSRGSSANLTVRLEQGPQLGGAIGAGIKIDGEAIHVRLELDGNFGLLGTDLRASFTLKYEDIKHAIENISNAVIAGPIGRAASMVFHKSQSEHDDNSIQETEVSQKEDKKDLEEKNPETKDSIHGEEVSRKDVSHHKFIWQLLSLDD